MNAFVDRLLAHVPGGYDTDPLFVPALEISGSGFLSMTGNTLYITSNGTAHSFDLYGISVSQLAQQLQSSGITYFVGGVDGSMLSTAVETNILQTGIVELLTLDNGLSSASLPATLYLPSNELYYVLGMQARVLEGRRRSAASQIAQINLQAAVTRLLDWWGASTGIARYQGEPDILYAQRIIGMRFRRTQNNYSIERLFKTLGYEATVNDTDYGELSVQITVPTSPPNGFVYSLGQLADILKRVKSATYKATVTVQASLTDAVKLTDSLSVTLNAQGWTVGNVIVGQFTV